MLRRIFGSAKVRLLKLWNLEIGFTEKADFLFFLKSMRYRLPASMPVLTRTPSRQKPSG